MPEVCRIFDEGDHGGIIVTGSDDTYINSRKVARIGDIYDCAVHGPNPLVTGSPTYFVNSRAVVRIGDLAECGARMITGSPNHFADG